MVSSIKRTLLTLVVAGSVTLGFIGGRHLHQAGSLDLGKLDRARALLMSASSGDIGGTDRLAHADESVPPASIFESVLDYVQSEYVEGYPGGGQLSNGALGRMLASLKDPKTGFLEPSVRQARQDALSGRYAGIGAALTIKSTRKADVDYNHLSIVAVMPGSPAEKAGLKAGDFITDIDNRWIIAYSILVDAERIRKMKGDDAKQTEEVKKVTDKFKKAYSLSKAYNLLNTGADKSLQLSIERNGAPMKVAVTTAVTEVDPVEFKTVKGGIGYLHIRQFNKKATQEFEDFLSKQGANMPGLIVDLRSNPGGVRTDGDTPENGYGSALKLIGSLTGGGSVATLEKKPRVRESLIVPAEKALVKVPMVVLVDQGTANIAELVASALRDAGKAKLIGTTTFGDPVLQFFAVLKDGSGMEIANAHMLTANGVEFTDGLKPDIAVAATVGGDDAALQKALTTLGA